MDSPETAKPTNTVSSDSVTVQDSPIFSYISNLSPIKPLKAAPVAQGFPGLNSPPLVFTSPRANTRCQSSFLKRPQLPQSSSSELSQQEAADTNNARDADESGKSDTKLSGGLIFSPEECDNNGSVHYQTGSPSGCADGFLADLAEVACADSTHSGELSVKQSDDIIKSSSDLADSKDSRVAVESKDDVREDAGMAAGSSPAILNQDEENYQEKFSFDIKPEAEKKRVGGDMPSSICQKVEPDDHGLDRQHSEKSVSENEGAGRKVEFDCTSQLLSESKQIVHEYKACVQATEAIASEPVENMMIHDPKASQHYRGKRRRCLQFDGAQQNVTANSSGSGIPSNGSTSSNLLANPADAEVLESYFVDVPSIPSNRQLESRTQTMFSAFSPKNDGTCSLKVSKPSGIGLHLNSIVNSMPMGSGANANIRSVEKGYLTIRGTKSLSLTSSHLTENVKNSLISSNAVESVTASTTDCGHESCTPGAASAAPSEFTDSVEPLKNSMLLKAIEHQVTQFDKRKPDSEHDDRAEEYHYHQSSPKKKRKKTSGADDGDGCKRCNCKKTKCLKLYCDCFAAGIYCAEPCSCQECFNRPEYEDTVLDTRQQIESRNPLAFAPKVTQRITEPPSNSNVGDGNRSTPSSARHKRGCNCKKSMCVKKYCECYQANVGCSDGCRCEGCKNVYGKKEEYGMSKDLVSKQVIETLDGSYDEMLDMVASKNSLLQIELCNAHNLTPLTPSFQYSKYCQSPESDLTFLAPYGKFHGSSRNSDTDDMMLETGKEIMYPVSFDQQLDYGNAETMDEFSPISHGLGNIGYLNESPNPPSVNILYLTSPNSIPWENSSSAQLFPGSGHFSSAGSLRWRSSPITPMTRFGETKYGQVLDSDEKLHGIMEDDTPEILKDASTPGNAVKVSSPNKKRVSPPHRGLQELGSSSSAGLRTSRKFILQAVPAFPPLTPCIDSTDSNCQNTNDIQECTSTK